MGILDSSLDGNNAANTEIANKGSLEIQRGMAEMKGRGYTAPTATSTTTTTAAPPSVGNPVYGGGPHGGTTAEQPLAPVSGYGMENKGGYTAPTATSTTTTAAPPSVGVPVHGGSGGTTVQPTAAPPVSGYGYGGTEYEATYQAPSASTGTTRPGVTNQIGDKGGLEPRIGY